MPGSRSAHAGRFLIGLVTRILAVRRVLWLAAVLGVVFRAEAAIAQAKAPVEPHVKAAFLYNFVKFVEWSGDHAEGPVTVCVAGSPAVAESLKTATQQRADERAIAVVQVSADAMPKACHVVYVADADEQVARRWLALLHGSTAFSVSDCERFATLGGIANFFVQDGRLRFAINVDAARRAGLRISSRMLALARIVRNDAAPRDVRIPR
jgi:hypothetical protein